MLINRVGGAGENVSAEVNIQTPLVTDIAAILGAIAGRPAGTHLWAKFESEGGNFIELAVSSEEDTYPNGDVANGYYYEKIFHVVCQDENGTYLLELAGAPESGDEPDVPVEPDIPDEPDVPVVYKKASEYAVGDSVWLNVNGTPYEFIVINQGAPIGGNSWSYTNVDGTWLIMKQVYGNAMAWASSYSRAVYANSAIHPYLNDTFFSMLDASTQSAVLTATIPYSCAYTDGEYTSGTVTAKVFIPSMGEVYSGEEGQISYFYAGSYAKRIAYDAGGTARNWWLRTGFDQLNGDEDDSWESYHAHVVGTNGMSGASEVRSVSNNETTYVRPCMILDSNTEFDASTNTIKM